MILKPKVSIALVTYNRSSLLPKTIESILSQSYSNFELIISDDCSTDETESICRHYARHDSRIKYIRNKTNLGMPGNLNASLKVTSGEYVANLHDGDIYHPDLIEKWKACLDTYPTAAFVFNAYRTTNENQIVTIHRESYPSLIEGRILVKRLLSRWDSCVFGTVMARRPLYEKYGWFDPTFGNFSDIDMWLRLAAKHDVGYINEPLIDLMRKDKDRFYSFVHWRVVFWILSIHVVNLSRCHHLSPSFTEKLRKRYRFRRQKYFLENMLLCIKHCRFDRVKEGLSIWRDSDDILLNKFGLFFGKAKYQPHWYTPRYWTSVQAGDSKK